jgi:polyvinyl alcohol dehydrogenase (cytochrome)
LAVGLSVIGACGDGGGKAPSPKEEADAGSEDAAAPARTTPAGWESYGYDLSNSQFNPNAGALKADSVSKLGEAWRVLVGGGATGTPVVSGDTVYFGGWDGTFYAVKRADGELLWKSAIGRQYVRSTPLIAGDRLYVAADNMLVALSLADGKTIFQTVLLEHPQAFIESSPKLADGVIVIGLASYELNLMKTDYSFDGAILGLDADKGDILWKVPVTGTAEGPCMGGSGVSVWSSAGIDPALGLAYIGTGQTYEKPASTCNDTLLAIHYKADYEGERVAWKATYTPDDVYVAAGGGLNGLDHDIGAAPNLFRAGDVDAVGAGDKGGTYRAFNRQTGEPLWRADLMTSTLAQQGGVMTTAAVADGTIYVTSNSWMAFGFITNGMHNPADTSILYALDAKDGSVRWMQMLDAPVFGTFAVANGVLFHPTIKGVVYARDVSNGNELWKFDVGAPIGSGISIDDQAVYVSSGFALGVRSASGQISRFALDAPAVSMRDYRENTFKEMTAAQCQESLKTLQPDAACRQCLCDCNASTTGACQAGCWEQASCVVSKCGTADFGGASGPACYADNCSSKLLPPNVYQESIRSAKCAVTCATACKFQ